MKRIIGFFQRRLSGNAFATVIFGLFCTFVGFFINFAIEHKQLKDAVSIAATQFEPIKSRDLQKDIFKLEGEISQAQDLQRMNELAWKDIRSDLNSVKQNVQFLVDWFKPDIKKKAM